MDTLAAPGVRSSAAQPETSATEARTFGPESPSVVRDCSGSRPSGPRIHEILDKA